MRAICTIPREEYARMLFEASQHINKKLLRLSDEEDMKSRTADDKGDEEAALKHWFRAQAFSHAAYLLTINIPTPTAEGNAGESPSSTLPENNVI